MHVRIPWLTAFVAASIAARVAGAQTLAPESIEQPSACVEGRVLTPAGRCCWPLQSWNEDDGRCVGAPHCPDDRAAEGDTCVPRAATTAPPRTPRPRTVRTRYLGGEIPPGATLRKKRHYGMLAFAANVLTTTYVPAFAVAVVGMFNCGGYPPSTECHHWPWIIPVFGGFIAAATQPYSRYNDGSLEWGLAIGAATLELASTALIVWSWPTRVWVIEPVTEPRARRESSVHWAIFPATVGPGPGLGATLLASW